MQSNKNQTTYAHLAGVTCTVVAGEPLWLHPFRAAYWPKEEALFIADLHLGKVAHFRSNGLAVPADAANENWDRLISLLIDFEPARVLFLGDLFHSTYNQEWPAFCDLLERFPEVSFELIIGNHDILPATLYEAANIVCHAETLLLPPFELTHHPGDPPPGYYNLSGHIHPCVVLQGRGRQYVRLPCFYFGAQQGILPAFGTFTGMARVYPKEAERAFVLTEGGVIEV